MSSGLQDQGSGSLERRGMTAPSKLTKPNRDGEINHILRKRGFHCANLASQILDNSWRLLNTTDMEAGKFYLDSLIAYEEEARRYEIPVDQLEPLYIDPVVKTAMGLRRKQLLLGYK